MPVEPAATAGNADEVAAVLSAALGRVERYDSSQVVIVLEDAQPPHLRNAAAGLRCTVFKSNLRKSSRYSLPEGYFLLHEVSVSGSTAIVRGLLGEVPKPRPGIILLSCGTTYTIPLDKAPDGSWKVRESEVTLMVC